MRAVYIAIGNRLRRDDGAAQRVVEVLRPSAGAEVRLVHQLSPENAEWLEGKDTAVFIDASLSAGGVRLEPADPEDAAHSPLAHFLPPAAVVALARALYGFTGQAWLCHVPGADFGSGEGLSREAEANAQAAAALLRARGSGLAFP